MKIVAGMGSVDDYVEYVKAGADELFGGYVPSEWLQKYGPTEPINRREVMYYNVQIGSKSELLILSDMIKKYEVPVSLTFNRPQYDPTMYPLLADIIEECFLCGFDRYIIADPGFLEYLYMQRKKLADSLRIHISGELGEVNRGVPEALDRRGTRVIFPRQTLVSEMASLTESFPQKEFEAFVLNEKCRFTGAYCNSIHCDELCHMCYVPYRLSNGVDFCEDAAVLRESADTLGETGCGLCALYRLRAAGITHLKIVSRGNDTETTVRDINTVVRALEILEQSPDERIFIRQLQKEIFAGGCFLQCYYREVTKNGI